MRTDNVAVVLVVPVGDEGPAPGVTLDWRGVERYAARVPDTHRLPMELFAEGRLEEGAKALLEQKETYLAELPWLEQRFNAMGYGLLGEEKHAQAIVIFTVNVQLFPKSANTYDSLGEAYMTSGERGLAIENYEKALELAPDSENAKRMLEQLRED